MADKDAIITAVKNLDICLKVPDMRGATLRLNKQRQPYLFSGGFNMVFQLSQLDKRWALRVWYVRTAIDQVRYRLISETLQKSNLPYFAKFRYETGGLIVGQQAEDIVLMEWLDGLLLKDYLSKHLNDPKTLRAFAEKFRDACEDLRIHQIAHGDLQEGNILVNDHGEIHFIDYDSICIPELVGQADVVTGLKGYQHPSRFQESKASLKADYFSELIIYLSIVSLIYRPDLWDKYQVETTQYLLFTEDDLANLKHSDIYRDLSALNDEITELLSILERYLSITRYQDLEPMDTYLRPPVIKHFHANALNILSGQQVTLNWEVRNAAKISIAPKIGTVVPLGQFQLTPLQDTIYILTAVNSISKVEAQLVVKVLPATRISFGLSRVKILSGESALLKWSVEYAERVTLIASGEVEEMPSSGEMVVSPKSDINYQLKAQGLDGQTETEQTLQLKVFQRTDIQFFATDTYLVLEGMPITLSWIVKHADKLLLTSAFQADLDVTGKNKVILSPNRTITYVLKASNALSEVQSLPIQLNVQPLPALPALNELILKPGDILPQLPLNLNGHFEQLNQDSQDLFRQVMQPQKRYSLKSIFKDLWKVR
ncbi:hypothetical protein D0C36_23555 [Mucilaginibacter conchicola]|uniref:Protein kinase domain-containing protein n=1 Tax=Mucilaginibacter conchicola TaxID=2303333 RepID=A0A372NN27_9SPHI|nr:hypothetical protein [Mucilaginibacter conchicola]RFZ90007.1 hypothetical protein D0C36_23555 [Mucilaginibacter conchicola]